MSDLSKGENFVTDPSEESVINGFKPKGACCANCRFFGKAAPKHSSQGENWCSLYEKYTLINKSCKRFVPKSKLRAPFYFGMQYAYLCGLSLTFAIACLIASVSSIISYFMVAQASSAHIEALLFAGIACIFGMLLGIASVICASLGYKKHTIGNIGIIGSIISLIVSIAGLFWLLRSLGISLLMYFSNNIKDIIASSIGIAIVLLMCYVVYFFLTVKVNGVRVPMWGSATLYSALNGNDEIHADFSRPKNKK
ncbi:MAG: hypothetical protein LBS74_07095 [Oscillospiraceae bacterium]|jgi:hypothetical protein|nr:hypothetical protein [Oscillospiraceae bacterium]